MDDYLRAILLGAIQALSEFLPISSSAHLLLAEEVMGASVGSLTFDVGLHVGTLVAVLAYFWRDWLEIIGAGLRDIASQRWRLERWSASGRLGLWIAIGTVPAVVIGFLFDGWIEEHARSPVLAASMLIGVAILMDVVDRRGAQRRDVAAVTLGSALFVGVAQAIALVPGVSRSGITITAGRALGFERASAARFSFLLSAPAVLGAAVLKLGEAASGNEHVAWGPMLAGALVAGVVGLAVIRLLLTFLQTHTLRVFVWYRIALGLAVLAAVLAGAL